MDSVEAFERLVDLTKYYCKEAGVLKEEVVDSVDKIYGFPIKKIESELKLFRTLLSVVEIDVIETQNGYFLWVGKGVMGAIPIDKERYDIFMEALHDEDI